MTRVLYWNLLSCGANSLYPPPNGKRKRAGDDDPDYGAPAAPTDAATRRTIFLNVVNAVDPDIIAIVEMIPGPGGAAEGTLLADRTAYDLMRELRNHVHADFRLVPPIASGTGGRTEGVAVYYRQTNLRFVGPFGWSGAISDRITNIGVPGLATYPPPWSGAGAAPGCLPNRVLNAYVGMVPWLQVGINENTLAGQWRHNNAAGVAVQFPAAGYRRPFRTSFVDTAAAPNRLIEVYTCHVPPQVRNPVGATLAARRLAATANARAAVAALAGLPRIAGAIGANRVTCIVGDFNISAWDADSDPTSYALLRNLGYRQHLNPQRLGPPNPPPAPLPATWPTLGYYSTHLRGTWASYPYVSRNGGANVRGYPGFIYVNAPAQPGRWYDAIDHIFTRYGGADTSANFTIVNPVTGSPYNADPAPPPNVVHGNIVAASEMAANPLAYPPGIDDQGPGFINALLTWRTWQNFPKIRSLSDHMPVAIDL